MVPGSIEIPGTDFGPASFFEDGIQPRRKLHPGSVSGQPSTWNSSAWGLVHLELQVFPLGPTLSSNHGGGNLGSPGTSTSNLASATLVLRHPNLASPGSSAWALASDFAQTLVAPATFPSNRAAPRQAPSWKRVLLTNFHNPRFSILFVLSTTLRCSPQYKDLPSYTFITMLQIIKIVPVA